MGCFALAWDGLSLAMLGYCDGGWTGWDGMVWYEAGCRASWVDGMMSAVEWQCRARGKGNLTK